MRRPHLRGFEYVVLGLLAAFAWRIINYHPVFTPDSERYIDQARSLAAGSGFTYRGELTAALAPGYPLFLAILSFIHPSLEFVRAVQVALSVLSCLILFRAVLPASPTAAVGVLWALALHPMVAAYSWAILSEPLAVALASTLALLVSRAIRDRGKTRERLVLGIIAAWLALTAPAFVFIFYPLSLYLLWRERLVLRNSLAYCAGVLALIVPWQLHCYVVTGSLQPAMVQTSAYTFDAAYGMWTRSWLVSPEDLAVGLGSGESIRNLPDQDFTYPSERQKLADTRERFKNGTIDAEEHDAVFRSSTEAIIARDPLRYYLFLPAERALILWTYMPQLGHFDPGYIGVLLRRGETVWAARDMTRSVLRWGKGVASLVVYGLYLCYPIAFLVLAYLAGRRRSLPAMIIVTGVLAYTFASAVLANGEVRRNLPFVPLLLFLAGFACRSETRAGSAAEVAVQGGPRMRVSAPS